MIRVVNEEFIDTSKKYPFWEKYYFLYDDVTGRYLKKDGSWQHVVGNEDRFLTEQAAKEKGTEYFKNLGKYTIVYQPSIAELEQIVNRYLERNFVLIGGVFKDDHGNFYQAVMPSM